MSFTPPFIKPKTVHPARKRRVRTALNFYVPAAWITGIFLILLVIRMVCQYLLKMDIPEWATWVAIAHGWAFMAYVVATLNLSLKARWPVVTWLTTTLAGVVPFLSFYVEHERRKQVTKEFQLDQPDVELPS